MPSAAYAHAPFQGGKSFAKRQTFFDAIFMPRSGDEGIVSFLISIVISFLVNLIIGLVAALFAFAYELYHLAWEYQTTLVRGETWWHGGARRACAPRPWPFTLPSPLPLALLLNACSPCLPCGPQWQGFLFFFVGMLGAWAIVASYIGAMYVCVGSGFSRRSK